MNYKEYYETYYNYRQAKNKLHKIQNDIADTISAMLSVTSQMKEDNTKGSTSNDKLLLLTAKKIDLEGKEVLAMELFKMREKQKNDAEKELRKNVEIVKDIKDTIYLNYYIDHIKAKQIVSKMNYSVSYIYSIITEIRLFINDYNEKHKRSKKK